jgi:hypothetical protein
LEPWRSVGRRDGGFLDGQFSLAGVDIKEVLE